MASGYYEVPADPNKPSSDVLHGRFGAYTNCIHCAMVTTGKKMQVDEICKLAEKIALDKEYDFTNREGAFNRGPVRSHLRTMKNTRKTAIELSDDFWELTAYARSRLPTNLRFVSFSSNSPAEAGTPQPSKTKRSPSWLDSSAAESSEPYIDEGMDDREIVYRQIRERRGQQKFRDVLVDRFNQSCVVTGCKILAVLEAAHIKPYRGAKDNLPNNGLLLRADIHTLFDLDLLGIEPTKLQIEIHIGLSKEYGELSGRRINCSAENRPSPDALAARYNDFCRRKDSPL